MYCERPKADSSLFLASYLKPKEYFNILDEPWLNNEHASYPSFFVLALFCTLQTYYSASRGCFIMWAFQFTQGHGMPGLKNSFSIYVMIMYNVYIHVCSLCICMRYMFHYAGLPFCPRACNAFSTPLPLSCHQVWTLKFTWQETYWKTCHIEKRGVGKSFSTTLISLFLFWHFFYQPLEKYCSALGFIS